MIEYPGPGGAPASSWRGCCGIEDAGLGAQVDGFEPVHAIADEDLERENDEKTSSVHFLRFELSAGMVAAARDGAAISIGSDHPEYEHHVAPVPEPIRASLAADLG